MSPFCTRAAYFGKEDLGRGFHCLRKGVDDHDFLSLYMRIGFAWAAEDPRYRALVQRAWPDEFPLRG